MRRSRQASHAPPTPPLVDPHDEVTVVDLGDSVRMPDGRVKPRIHFCDGRGFELEILGEGFVSPCWCPAGKRLICAVPSENWPLKKAEAARLAKRLGLRRAA